MKSLSLYTIEDALLELTSAREQLLEDLNQHLDAGNLEQQAEKQQELKAVDALLAQYVTLETRKVDNIHSFLQWSKDTAAAARVHAGEFMERARMIEGTAKLVGRLMLDVMTVSNKKTVDGSAGRKLARQGNGGLQPLQVDGWNEEMKTWTVSPVLPMEFVDVTVKVPATVWAGMLEDYRQFQPETWVEHTEPSNGRLRAALAELCPQCHGFTDYCADVAICETCKGQGKPAIPGARLLDRGEHLRVK